MVLEAVGDGLEADEVFETRTGVEISPEQMLNAVLARMTWGWSAQPVDNTDVYRRRVATANGGTIMPCSPGVEWYTVSGWFGGQSLIYDMEWKWRPGVLEFLKGLPPQQVLHRSRQIALSAKPLIAGELDRRAAKLHDNRAQLDDLRSSVQQQHMAELSTMVIQETIKHMSYNWEHIQEYIAEHDTRGTGTGYKWGQLKHVGKDGWLAIYERVSEYLEDALLHQGEYVTGLFETGIRARGDPLTLAQITSGKIEGTEKTRDRMVMFRAILSMEGAFLLDKPAWYQSMMEKSIDILDFEYDVEFPMVIGGQAYCKAAEYLQSGLI